MPLTCHNLLTFITKWHQVHLNTGGNQTHIVVVVLGLSMFSTNFNNISVLLWWSLLLMGENQSSQRKPQNCCKPLTNFITYGFKPLTNFITYGFKPLTNFITYGFTKYTLPLSWRLLLWR